MTPQEIKIALVDLDREIGVIAAFMGDNNLGGQKGMYDVTLQESFERIDGCMDKLMMEFCK